MNHVVTSRYTKQACPTWCAIFSRIAQTILSIRILSVPRKFHATLFSIACSVQVLPDYGKGFFFSIVPLLNCQRTGEKSFPDRNILSKSSNDGCLYNVKSPAFNRADIPHCRKKLFSFQRSIAPCSVPLWAPLLRTTELYHVPLLYVNK